MAARKFISWQPVLTDHQAFTLQALAREANTQAVAYVTTMEDAVRKEQGWSDTQVTSVERRLIPKRHFLLYCYRQLRAQRTEVHLFGSPFQQPRLILCMLFAAFLHIEFYLISEPYSPEADGYLREGSRWFGMARSKLRPLIYRGYVWAFCAHVAGIFAISRLAVDQYHHAGMPMRKLFPFGYFIPAEPAGVNDASAPEMLDRSCLRIVFIGSLIRRKGTDLLIAAVRRLVAQGCKVHVDLYGPGDPDKVPPNEVGIQYKGLIPFGHAQKIVAGYDLLVLPSRYDGWGVVVNEALCVNVPVVCSDRTGAGVVAAALGAGLTFPAGDAEALGAILGMLAAEPLKLNTLRAACADARRALQPEVAARYMLQVIQAPADRKADIAAPWYPLHK